MVKSILITGGLGFIGSHVISYLEKSDFDSIIILDNLCNSNIKVLKTLRSLIPDEKIIFYAGDIRNDIDLQNIFENHYIDVVIHMAGLKSVKESTVDPLMHYDNNVLGTIKLLTYMKEHECNKLIFSSSAVVYGSSPAPYDVNSNTGTGITNAYGRSKYMIEEIIKDTCKSYNFKCIMLRYFNPIGAHPSGLIGEYPNGAPNNLFPNIIMNAKGTIPELKVFGEDYDTIDGTCIRDYIDINDLALAHVSSIDRINSLEENLKIYNLGIGRGVSVIELLSYFERVNDLKLNYSFVERRPGDLPVSYASVNEETYKELHWKPVFTLEDSCRNGWLFAQNL